MGAHEFVTAATGESVDDAFSKAVKEAQYMNGHGGYTGTIAEKGAFTLIPQQELGDQDPYEFANDLIRGGDQRIDDKWGPAGAVKIDDNKWLFFGRASS